MSLTLLGSALALLVSLLALLPLAQGDPKRLRQAGFIASKLRQPLRKRTQTLLRLLVLAPALPLMMLGLWAPLLIWLAALSAAGWSLALLLAPRRGA